MLKIYKTPIKFLLFVSLLIINLMLNAQKIVNTTGTAQVCVEGNMTENETREQAKNLAMINAIENAFGTYAEQQLDMTIKDGLTSYNIIGTTKVKGDWIETIGVPKFNENFEKLKTNHGVVTIKYISCTIKGKVRKSILKANIEYEILNGPNLLSRTRSFYSEEPLYVYFKSPVNGFLSIFLEDDIAVYRLLPYKNMGDDYQSGVPIISDTDYLFFSPDNNSFLNSSVDEQSLFTLKKDIEYNYIHIVFSEDEYVKPVLESSSMVDDRIIPKQLLINKFQQWLANNRASSEKFQDIKLKISIKQNN